MIKSTGRLLFVDGDLLLEWLQRLGLENFHEKLLQLGCEELEHLVDVQEENLKIMGFLPLQIRRFLRDRSADALSQFQPAAASTLENSSKLLDKLVVQMPSTSFGRAVVAMPATKLIAKYEDLYYKERQNYKHRACNSLYLACHRVQSAVSWIGVGKRGASSGISR